MKKQRAFTLAEVLITLGVIGVVAAMTMPSLIQNHQKKELLNQFKVAYSTMQTTFNKAEYDLGYKPLCFYRSDRPSTQVSAYLDEDCEEFWNYMYNNLKVVKFCKNNAYENGCIPDYNGFNEVYATKDPSLSEDDITQITNNCPAWRTKDNVRSQRAAVLSNGMIILYYGKGSMIFAIDVNGKKGPNKWGYDLFSFSTVSDVKSAALRLKAGIVCNGAEKGGKTTSQMMQSMGD